MRALILGLAMAASAGAALAQTSPAAPAASVAAAASAPQASTRISDYRLGAGDKIRVIVYNEANLSGEFIVGPSGSIAFPLVGAVDAYSKTVGELQTAIEARLKDGYVKDPHVSIEVLTYRPFYILGEVNRPGEYPYSAGLTVTRAVATASGFTYRANTRRVFIKHPGEKQEHPFPADSTTPIVPGDIIRVAERFF